MTLLNEKNKTKTKIAHIIYNDKFTLGYIQFMKFYFSEFDQMFLVVLQKTDQKQDYPDEDDILYFVGRRFSKNTIVLKTLNEADKIIVSGMFGYIPKELPKLDTNLLSKAYIQFWGRDFYDFRKKKIKNFQTLKRMLINKRRVEKCIKRCAAVITLIDNDWDELYKIFPYDKKHFTAPMPGDPEEKIDFESYREKIHEQGPFRILVGNSATASNHHEEVFKLLQKFSDEDMEVVVPLSYGDDQYKNEILKIGKNLLGSKFCPITDFMKKEDYIALLNTCDIGIFDVDRQQAMGNINFLLLLGKKVYLRTDSPLWQYYKGFGISPSDINEIANSSFEDLKRVDLEKISQNIAGELKIRSDDRKVSLWRVVLED